MALTGVAGCPGGDLCATTSVRQCPGGQCVFTAATLFHVIKLIYHYHTSYKPSPFHRLRCPLSPVAMSNHPTHNVHLLVLIHGMWGTPRNLASMHRIMKETRLEAPIEPNGTALHIMLPETNQAESTYDGIDWGGERVAAEASISIHCCLIASLIAFLQIFQEIEKLESEGKTVTRFSVTGYSMGGLLARYVVGCVLLLHCLY